MFCSILISNFNKSKYIERCLNSILSQSYKNFEIIFSDNESTDNSIRVVNTFEYLDIKTEVVPVSESTYPSEIKRPKNSVMSLDKVKKIYNPQKWEEGLLEYLKIKNYL